MKTRILDYFLCAVLCSGFLAVNAQDELFERTLNCNFSSRVNDLFNWGDSSLIFESCYNPNTGSDGRILSMHEYEITSIYTDLLQLVDFQTGSDTSFWIGGSLYDGCLFPSFESYTLHKFNQDFTLNFECPIYDFPDVDELEIFYGTGDDNNPIQLNDSIVLDFYYGHLVYADIYNNTIITNEELYFSDLRDVFLVNDNALLIQQDTSLSILVGDQIEMSVSLEVIEVFEMGENYIVQTPESIEAYDSELNQLGVYIIDNSIEVIDFGVSNELLVLISDNGQFEALRFDEQMNLLGNTPIETQNNWTPTSGISVDAKLLIGGYTSLSQFSQGVLKEYDFQGLTQDSGKDIAISIDSYDIVQTPIDIWNGNAIFNVVLQNVVVEISNYSIEEIETFDLYYQNDPDPGNNLNCGGGQVQISIDTSIPPGGTLLYEIPSVIIEYYVFEDLIDLPLFYDYHTCFTVLGPNQKLDNDLSNNQTCIDDSFIVTSLDELKSEGVNVRYNTDQSLLQITSATNGTLDLYTSTGSLIRSHLLQAGLNEVNLDEFSSGIYIALIQVNDQRFTEKLLVD